MKKIEGYVRDKNDPRQTIYQLDTASQGHFEQPAILLIAEGGEQLPEVPEWISVEDRLPELPGDDKVLTLLKPEWTKKSEGPIGVNKVRYLYDETKRSDCIFTHWQPLPKAPHQ